MAFLATDYGWGPRAGSRFSTGAVCAVLVTWAAHAGADPSLPEPGLGPKSVARPERRASPADIPDIYGPGAVLNVGNVHMKVTNMGVVGNPFFATSADPSGQWPGASGVEYLNAIVLAVGAVNPGEIDPTLRRRVSSGTEWRPATLDPVDRIYSSFEGVVGGKQLVNDDNDRDPFTGLLRVDEEFLDGRDNDGDGRIDEDHAAVGHLMFSCMMRDDTPAALAAVSNERHVPLGLECRQRAWAYSIPGFTDFNVIEYTVFNRSGHTLDSLYLGFPTDLDAGAGASAGYYIDDLDLPFFPNGLFRKPIGMFDPRRQGGFCTQMPIAVKGFSVVDNDGDQGHSKGVASLLLFGHTLDPLGLRGPRSPGFSTFRSFANGTSFINGGAPITDRQRYEVMTARENIDPEFSFVGRFIQAEPRIGPDDYASWNAIGPFLDVPDGGSITATIGFAVGPGSYEVLKDYPEDYARYRAGLMTQDDLFFKYPALENAFNAQVAYEGLYERPRPGYSHLVPDCAGCEFGLQLPPGTPGQVPIFEGCLLEELPKWVNAQSITWFNKDCNFCTGVAGHYLRRWDTPTPPTPPNVNVTANYNYSDNPDRIVPTGDRQVTLAWDNISENVPDPKSGWFDFRTYRVWKVAEWRRPVGTSAPTDDDWSLLAEFRLFDYADSNFRRDPVTDTPECPKFHVPNYTFPPGHERCAPENSALYPGRVLLSEGGCRDTATIGICLRRGDLLDRQTGQVLNPDPATPCVRDSAGGCVQDIGRRLGRTTLVTKTRYQVGRYHYVDREVKNGFAYFYSVTGGDSTADGELFGMINARQRAVEADAVIPQAATRADQSVWVVPNPYRGYATIGDRSSAWDLTPTAADPTGTYIDFMGMPAGPWKLSIYTVAGDLVAELHSSDPVNESSRSAVIGQDGRPRAGYNRQQDNPNDGQARWNLITRNGQDVVSGIYLFVVDSSLGQQRGKFVIIR